MHKGPMSPAAWKKIAAQRRRRAAYRKAKNAGKLVARMGKTRGRPAGRCGRPTASGNRFLGMTAEALGAAKQFDHEWRG